MARDENTGSVGGPRGALARLTRRPVLATAWVAVFCAGCGAAAAAQTVAATTPTPTPAAPAPAVPAHALIGAFHFSSNDFKIDSNAPSELVMATTVLAPQKSSGWHTHPGPAFVLVINGTVVRYQVATDGTCTSVTYTAGQGFVEPPGAEHIVRNESAAAATLQATFLDVAPGTTAYKTPAPIPAGCPGIS